MANKSIKMYEELCEMLEDELSAIVKKKEVTQENLDWIDKLTHSIKSVKTTVAMLKAEEGDYGNSYDSSYGMSRNNSYGNYSRDYNRDSYDGMSNRGSYDYSRGSYDSYDDRSYDYSRDGSYDGRRGRDNDNDGRYSERNDRRDGRGRYSRNSSNDHMIEKLETMKEDVMDKRDKEAIQKLIHELKN